MTGAIKRKTENFGLNIINYDFPRWHTYDWQNWDTLDAVLSAAGLTAVRGVWENNTLYTAGERVVDPVSSSIWICAVTHTSAVSGTFADDRTANPTYWKAISSVPIDRGEWVTGVVYNTWDIVTHENGYYCCVVQHTSGDFDTDYLVGNWVLIFDLQPALDAETNAAASALSAGNSASAASTSETNAANSASAANTSANNAATSETNAGNSATAASTSETNAANSETNAGNSATAAATSEGNAYNYAISAANSAAAAATFDPANYYTKVQVYTKTEVDTIAAGKANTSHTHITAQITGLATALAGKVSKSGDTMTGALEIQYSQPNIWLHSPSAYRMRIWLTNDGVWRLRNDGAGDDRFRVGTDGAVWTAQFGDLNTRIEDRAYAWAMNGRDQAINTANDRVHRIQFVGYGESAAAGWAYDAPVVVNDCFFNSIQVQRRVKTLQMHIPASGGWVNVWSG